jgi:hypothetical protein
MFWGSDWLLGLPVIVFTIVLHIGVLVFMERMLVRGLSAAQRHAFFRIGAVTCVALGAISLHAIEAVAWALLYLSRGALLDPSDAYLYSLSAISAFGHANIFLARRWQLLGAMEAINGVILFGLTTAFLFSAIQLARPDGKKF